MLAGAPPGVASRPRKQAPWATAPPRSATVRAAPARPPPAGQRRVPALAPARVPALAQPVSREVQRMLLVPGLPSPEQPVLLPRRPGLARAQQQPPARLRSATAVQWRALLAARQASLRSGPSQRAAGPALRRLSQAPLRAHAPPSAAAPLRAQVPPSAAAPLGAEAPPAHVPVPASAQRRLGTRVPLRSAVPAPQQAMPAALLSRRRAPPRPAAAVPRPAAGARSRARPEERSRPR